MITNKKHLLSDIFLDVLEYNGNKLSREFVRRVRLYIKSPDFAEIFNFLVVNSIGVRTRINRSTVDNAVDYLIKIYEKEIEDNHGISDKEKVKQQMRTDMYVYHDLLAKHISSNLLFE